MRERDSRNRVKLSIQSSGEAVLRDVTGRRIAKMRVSGSRFITELRRNGDYTERIILYFENMEGPI